MVKKTFREWTQEAEADPVYWTERAILSVTEEIFVAMERRTVTGATQSGEVRRTTGTTLVSSLVGAARRSRRSERPAGVSS